MTGNEMENKGSSSPQEEGDEEWIVESLPSGEADDQTQQGEQAAHESSDAGDVVDEVLVETFPASDPPSWTVTRIGPRGSDEPEEPVQ